MTDNNDKSNDFASMLQNSFKAMDRIEPGQKLDATIVNITNDWVFLDIGRKGEGVLDKKECINREGECTIKVGDSITVFFLRSKNSEMVFTTRLGRGDSGNEQLEEAFHNGIPVQGFVEKEIKGGFEVKIGGTVRAFCPFSQMALRRVADNAVFIGQHFNFYISEFSERGRNIVVSRRQMLLEEEEEAKALRKEQLSVGMVVKGKITNILPFGAFCDIGGVEGLIPVSEISYEHVTDINEILTLGQEVNVEIMRLDWEKNRHSFSLKTLLADPWEEIPSKYPSGTRLTGTVMRLMPFGAFVSIAQGIEGLLHISKIASPTRIQFPAQVLKVGQDIEVEVESIDVEKRRISLSQPMENGGPSKEDDENAWVRDYNKKETPQEPETMGAFGALL
ncbi:30S ribosomal protein S1, partial [Myxococcota bacterium]|nr:30S ribosomal protein S1 [Myxococcota bacterium]